MRITEPICASQTLQLDWCLPATYEILSPLQQVFHPVSKECIFQLHISICPVAHCASSVNNTLCPRQTLSAQLLVTDVTGLLAVPFPCLCCGRASGTVLCVRQKD